MARPGAGGKDESWEYSLRKYLLLLATLVATVTYSAGLNPPGGVWQTAGPLAANHIAGDPVMHDTNYARYLAFFYSNATAFASSLVVIVLVLILSVLHDNGAGKTLLPPLLGVLRAVMVLDLLSLMGAYAAVAFRDALTAVYSLVLSAGVVGYLVAHLVLASRSPAEEDNYKRGKSAPERLRKVLMLLATFAASVTYHAGLSAPGGFWDHREDGHRPGDAILKGGPHDARLKAFFVCNTTAFVASLLILVMLLEKKLCFSQKVRSYEIYGFIAVTLISLLAAYAAGGSRQTGTTIYVSALLGAVAVCILIQVVFVLLIQQANWSQHQGQQQTSANGNGSNEHQQTPGPQTSNENNGSDEHQQQAQVLQTSDDNNAGGEDKILFVGSEQTDFRDQECNADDDTHDGEDSMEFGIAQPTEGEMSATLGIIEFPTSSSLGTMGPLLQKLNLLLHSENQIIQRSAKEAIKLLKEDLEEINTDLVELSMVERPNYKSQYWMHEVRELSYHIEDCIDNMMQSRAAAKAKVRFPGRRPQLSVRRHVKILCLPKTVKPFASLGLRRTLILSVSSPLVRHPGFLKRFSLSWRHESRHGAPLAQLHQALLLIRPPPLSVRIAELRTMLREASERHERYQLQDSVSSKPRFLFPWNSHAPALSSTSSGAGADLVGVDGTRGKLTSWLIDQTEEEHRQLEVISIIGPAGVGKTALVKELYRQLGHQFECRAFVRVSRNPDMRRLLGEILAQVQGHKRDYENEAASTADNLMDSIRSHLQDKRYFVVIDELWDAAAWDIMNIAFPKGNNCSRIIITAEGKDVASKCYCIDKLVMAPLENLQDSGKIFFDRVFGSEHQCPDQLKDISCMIIRSCGGFPLAITAVASLLASQIDETEIWDYLQKCSVSRLTGVTLEETCKEVVNICYDALPQDLKTCLLYLTMYPEGSTIRKADLLNQWIAEGFITPKEENQTVAESYFSELINRGMIQPENIDHNDEVLSCTVHHIVFDLIAQKSREENFITAVDYSQAMPGFSMIARRLTLHFSCAQFAAKPEGLKLSQVRSLAIYGLLKCMPPITEFKFLRVLILEFWGDNYHHNTTTFDLSKLCMLFQLRYLKISSHIFIVLPSQIRRIQSLETLEIDAQVSSVPTDIFHLPGLLHLSLPKGTELPDGIGRITSLQTLEYFDLGSNSEDNAKSLGELINLQNLHVTCSKAVSDHHLKRNLVALSSSIGKLANLKSLRVGPFAVGMTMFIDQDDMPCAPKLLERLNLSPSSFIFSRLPTWIGALQKLCILKIAIRVLLSSDIDTLTGLPVLAVLSLYVQKPNAGSVIFNSGSLPALKYFKYRCAALRLGFQKEALPNLQRLKLCFNVHRAESYTSNLAGIENLLQLKEITAEIGAAAGAHESDMRAITNLFTQSKARREISVNTKDIMTHLEEVTDLCRRYKVGDIAGSARLHQAPVCMANLVTGAMGSLIPKLGELLKEEYNLQTGMKKRIKSLTEELESAQAAWRTVEMVPWDQIDAQVQIWARQVREASYDMEDVLDTFLVYVESPDSTKQKSLLKHLGKIITNLFTKSMARREISVNTNDIMTHLEEVMERCRRYKVGDTAVAMPDTASAVDPRLHAMYNKVEDLVGNNKSSRELISMLQPLQRNVGSNLKMKIVSILGVGGLGKTTLAKAVYDWHKGEFNCGAFVPVGRNPDLKKVLQDILMDVDRQRRLKLSEVVFDERQLIDELRLFLENKRYFIVIDDLWEEESWETIKLAFVDNNCGSRIIITTRKWEVAKRAEEVYKLQPLPDDSSRELFFIRIGGHEGKYIDNKPDEVTLKFLKKCAGIPLAIITMASLLVDKPRERWLELYRSIGFVSEDNDQAQNTMRIVSFSYYDLPAHLRTCLLYISAFQEDSIIPKDSLVWMWVAEGFVEKKQGMRLFDTGEGYFHDLINRSMIEAVKSRDDDSIVIGCRVHDMVLDFIRSMSHQENFFSVVLGNNNQGTLLESNNVPRRLAHHYRTLVGHGHRQGEDLKMAKVRSLFAIGCGIEASDPFHGFRLLRVLVIDNCKATIGGFVLRLEHVTHLLHLRFLSIRGASVESIPEEIGRLRFLQALDLQDSSLEERPSPGSFPEQLVRLFLPIGHGYGFRMHSNDDVIFLLTRLTSLEELSIGVSGQELVSWPLPTELRVLQLCINGTHVANERDFWEWVHHLNKLEHLTISGDCSMDVTDFVLPSRLRHFGSSIGIKFCKLPSCVSASCLSHLELELGHMEEHDLKILGMLPELRFLGLELWTEATVSSVVVVSEKDAAAVVYFPKLWCCRLMNGMVSFHANEEDKSISSHVWGGGHSEDKVQRPILSCSTGGASASATGGGAPRDRFMPCLQELRFRLCSSAWDNYCCDNLGWEYGLPSLRKISVSIAHGVRTDKIRAALRSAAKAHPNHPVLHEVLQ